MSLQMFTSCQGSADLLNSWYCIGNGHSLIIRKNGVNITIFVKLLNVSWLVTAT